MIICWKNKRSIDYTGDVLALFVTFLDLWASLCNSIFFFFDRNAIDFINVKKPNRLVQKTECMVEHPPSIRKNLVCYSHI